MIVKNLLLDMGGVILNVQYDKIITEFEKLGVDAKTLYTQTAQMPFIDDFEIGKITSSEFRDNVRNIVKKNLTDEQIDMVWNSMIIFVRKDTLKLLGKLKLQYNKIVLFSNTNEIHVKYCKKLFYDATGFDIFAELFDKTYFSNEIGLRKPHKESFLSVLKDAEIEAEETLFVDDTLKNIDGAKLAGLNAYLLEPNTTLVDLHNSKII